jgi:hypothetical protein
VTVRSPIAASVATRDATKPFVVVEFTEVKSVKLPFVAEKLFVKKLVELLLAATRFVTLALVVVEFVTVRSPIAASVATRDATKPFVVVEFTEVKSVKLPFVAEKLVVKKFVELLLVIFEFNA